LKLTLELLITPTIIPDGAGVKVGKLALVRDKVTLPLFKENYMASLAL